MKKTFITILILIILAVGWYLLSPLFITQEVDEAFPEQTSNIDATGELPSDLVNMQDVPDTIMEEAMPEENTAPEQITQGTFIGADRFHQGSGMAALYTLEDGSSIVRFEDFEVTNGPDLHVLLTEHPNPQNRSDIHSGEYIDLGQLKGNVGNQNYTLPSDIDPQTFSSVVIYCEPFSVVFATASLK